MNIKTLIALCLVVAFIASETDACVKLCTRYRCYIYGCHWYYGKLRCRYRCIRRCWYINCGKRDEPQSQLTFDDDSSIANSPASKIPGLPLPLDNKFSDYDKNKDGHITYQEFQAAMPPARGKDVREGFDLMDKNGDGKINCAEFLRSRKHVDYGSKKPVCK